MVKALKCNRDCGQMIWFDWDDECDGLGYTNGSSKPNIPLQVNEDGEFLAQKHNCPKYTGARSGGNGEENKPKIIHSKTETKIVKSEVETPESKQRIEDELTRIFSYLDKMEQTKTDLYDYLKEVSVDYKKVHESYNEVAASIQKISEKMIELASAIRNRPPIDEREEKMSKQEQAYDQSKEDGTLNV